MNRLAITSFMHDELASSHLAELRRLFDDEYPDQPYGYAPHDLHVIVRVGNRIVGHAGWGRRAISVSGEDIVIAGVGGVLISEQARGQGLGAQLMGRAALSMRDHGGIAFGYLGCREDVVPFYAACGWRRIVAGERSVGRNEEPVADPPGQPLLILPVDASFQSWPHGYIDLRGRAW